MADASSPDLDSVILSNPEDMKRNYRLLTAIICLFLLFAASMTIYVLHREENHHIDLLQTRLQEFNKSHTQATDSIRLTIIDLKGNVIYESTDTIGSMQHPNHLNRPEVQQAIREGSGYAVIRSSETTGIDYFYSATLIGDSVIVRSALPYNTELRRSFAADRHYLFAACLISLLLLALFLYMTRKMGQAETQNIELQTKLQLEQQYNQYKYQLSHNIAHELKTPVASIQGYLETIIEARKSGNISEEQLTHFLERSYSQSQRLNSLVQDISTLNKMAENSTLEREKTDVAALVRNILDEVALKLELQHMSVTDLLPAHLYIDCNASLVYSIFRNLIDNSIAYAGKDTTICIMTDGTGHFRYFDNGTGIPEEHLPRIFERFYRIDKGRSRRLGGTGLGLAIVKNAVLLHGGTITALNRQEGGLEFRFSLGKK